jgi:hypothetical protein
MSQLNDSQQRPPGLGALMVAGHVLMLAVMLRRRDHYGYRRPARGAVFGVARHCSTGLRSARRSMAKEA